MEMEWRSRFNEEHCLILNLIVEKGASKDHDRSKLIITRLRTGTPMGFVQRSWIEFWLVKICIYKRHVFYFYFYFSFIEVALTSFTCASITLALTVHKSIATDIHSFYFAIISSLFSSLLISFSHLFLISILILRETHNYRSHSPLRAPFPLKYIPLPSSFF